MGKANLRFSPGRNAVLKDVRRYSFSWIKTHIDGYHLLHMRYLVVLMLCGCTRLVAIDYNTKPPEDWPQLEERITYADVATVQRWCNMPQAIRDRAFNCAVVSFKHGLCMIYLSSKDPEALAHERAHCAGYGHVGDGDITHRAWVTYKRSQKIELFAQ
jgi:hypothetical protein